MSNFPNAKKGVSRLLLSEILSLIGVFVLLFAAIVAVIAISGISLVGAAISSVLIIAASVLMMLASILGLVGLCNGAHDSKYFKSGILFIVFALILSIISCFPISDTAKSILTSLDPVVDLVVMLFVIAGVSELIPDSPVVAKGKTVAILAAITCVLALVFALLKTFAILGAVAGIISLVLNAVYYILYLVFLAQAKKEL